VSNFRFLHAADIHLDSPLTGLGKFEEASVVRIQAATREALEGLVQYALDEAVDFVVIAGDLYDGDWKDHRTGLFFVQQMGRLKQAGVPVFVLKGNHDAASQISKSLQLPENVRVFNHRKPQSFTLDELDVVLHGQSFPKQHLHDNLVPAYPAPTEAHFNIGVLHTALEGGTVHADYAPCSLEELRNKGYDYWALGHVHQHRIFETEPHIVYPGNLQGRSIRETGPKGACLVTVEGGVVSAVDHVPLDVVRWTLLEIDVSEAESFADVTELVTESIHTAVDEQADGRLLACRIELRGETDLDGLLRAQLVDLRAEAIGATFHRGEPEAWIEKIRIATTHPAAADDLTERSDALSQVLESIPDALDDEPFTEELTKTLQAFRAALPHEVLEASDDELLSAVVEEDYATLLDGVRAELAAALRRAGR
jgi:DNA repair exonuclease SbcCD nuclease subunit